jgi:hypothetical protein
VTVTGGTGGGKTQKSESSSSLVDKEKNVILCGGWFTHPNEKELNRQLVYNLTDNLDVMIAPYVWGGRDPLKPTCPGVDCSGYLAYGLSLMGYNVKNLNAQLMCDNLTYPISKDELIEGDLAFYVDAKGKIFHVKIAVNDEWWVHSYGYGSDSTCSNPGPGPEYTTVNPRARVLYRRIDWNVMKDYKDNNI